MSLHLLKSIYFVANDSEPIFGQLFERVQYKLATANTYAFLQHASKAGDIMSKKRISVQFILKKFHHYSKESNLRLGCLLLI